ILRILRNDVDDAIDCVSSPYGSARASNDFDSVDVFKQRVLNLPIDAGKERRINAAPVDQHQKGLGEFACKSSYADSPMSGIDTGYLNVRREAQYLWNTCRARAAYVFLGNDKDC